MDVNIAVAALSALVRQQDVQLNQALTEYGALKSRLDNGLDKVSKMKELSQEDIDTILTFFEAPKD